MECYLHDDLMKRCTGRYKSVFRRPPAHHSRGVAKQWEEKTQGSAESTNHQKREKISDKESEKAKTDNPPKFGGGYDRENHPKMRRVANKVYVDLPIVPLPYERQGYSSKGKPTFKVLFHYYGKKKTEDLAKEVNESIKDTGLKAKVNSEYEDENIWSIEFNLN